VKLRSLFLALLSALPAFAAFDVHLAGQVLDAYGSPVVGVEVQLKDGDLKAVSDAEGKWSLVHEIADEATNLQNARLATGPFSLQSDVYNLLGRKMNASQLAQGVYILRDAAGASVQSRRLAKAAGEQDSLIVNYQGAEVGRVAVVDLLQLSPVDMTLVTVSPLVIPAEAKGTAGTYKILLGQTFHVTFQYDELQWLPAWLTVGSTQTPAQGKTFPVRLASVLDTNVTLTLTNRKQSISFAALDAVTYGDDFLASATTSSGLAVQWKSNTDSVCTVTGAMVHLVRVGKCELVASQAGDTNYFAATDVSHSFLVKPRMLTVAGTGTVVTKAFDSNVDASLVAGTHYQLVGVVGNDQVAINVTGQYNNANVLQANKVFAVYTNELSGAQAGNYSINAASLELTGAVIPKEVFVAAANKSKIYGDADPELTKALC